MSIAKKIGLTAAAVAATLLIAVVCFYVLYFRVVTLPTGSMANTLIPGDRVLCALRGGEVKRGDIVLFKLPSNPKVMYLKRVIGLPGERAQIRGTRVYINGQELPEARTFVNLFANAQEMEGPLAEISSEGAGPYRVYYEKNRDSDEAFSAMMKYGGAEEYQIPQGHYYVLGDCRDNSEDSRFWGTVPRELIVGTALMVVGSKNKGKEDRFFKPLK
jgi:signal peptidase I